MKLLSEFRHPFVAFVHDLLMIPVAWLGAYWLRFNLEIPPEPLLHKAFEILPFLLATQGGIFWYFGLYRGVWRFASMPDMVRIVKAIVAAMILSAAGIFFLERLESVPRSVFVLDGILLFLLLGGSRFVYRWLKERHFSMSSSAGNRTLIIGAGRAGEMLVRDMLREQPREYQPVAFIDDDTSKRNREIHGVRVVGACENIPDVISYYGIELSLIALPSASSKQIQHIVGICEKTGVPFRILPRLQDLMSGQVGLKELRDVRIEDLLGREKVTLDWQSIKDGLTGKSVMVTGGGGSIGSELCRQIASLRPSRLIILENNEFNLYKIDSEFKRDFPQTTMIRVLADICDSVPVEQVFRKYCPSVIFHAAAYKHVPMLEDQLRAAVVNNVLGTRRIADAAMRHQCESFVLISTDKAVNPTNIMGASKRIAEIYCQYLSTISRTRFITVRFGNVLGSTGSVVPLFQEQIARGGPVTVTHPDVTRYFMTLPEACQLILQASAIGRGGEIFTLDMGEPVKISYLAEQMIRLAGKVPGEDIEIVYTGLRPGEKLYEELFHEQENLIGTRYDKIFQARPREVDWQVLNQTMEQITGACECFDDVRLRSLITKLVPEFEQGTVAPRTNVIDLGQVKSEHGFM